MLRALRAPWLCSGLSGPQTQTGTTVAILTQRRAALWDSAASDDDDDDDEGEGRVKSTVHGPSEKQRSAQGPQMEIGARCYVYGPF